MPRSKSHNQSKHSSTEYSDIDDDVKIKETNDCKQNVVSGQKRKSYSNANVSDEFAATTKKRRRDRWNGDEGEVVNVDDDKEINSERENKVHNECPIKEEMRNIELEKELEKRMRRREGYSDRDIKHKEERYRDDVERDRRHKTGRARDDTDRKKRSRDHTSHSRGGSPIYDDRVARRKDNKDVRRDDYKSKDESSDYRSRTIHDQQLESKRYRNDHPSRDHHRVSKHEETKYRDTVHEARARRIDNSNTDLSDKVCIDDLSSEKRLKSDSQLSPSSTNKFFSHLPPPVDPNLGRSQTNWNSFPNWPYIPFHHAPPPMFNPFMYQSLPPMLGGPPMNTNHVTMPYHGFGNWDHGRTEVNDQSLEPNVVSVDLQSAVQKHEDSVDEHMDEIWLGPHNENEENDVDFDAPEVMKVAESFHVSMVGKDDDTLISRVYLSKIDVSEELTRPELYEQCKSMLLDLDQASSVSDDSHCKILFLEEGVEDDIRNGPSLFAAVDDSVFKKAMSLYTKQKVHFTATNTRFLEDQEKENIDVDHPVKSPETENIEVGHPVKHQETESCALSIGDSEVKVKVNYDGSKEVDNQSDSGSLLVMTNLSTSDLIEFGSGNLSRIHSLE
ncbi:hypothetical protein HanRHA438_Chr07g0293981 [Helianthus annuus]|uniref:Uncharacterized protein n=1 Tax=Helianthus annuus TaxID=4232 RepID=A0A251UA72_HELAN|nr:uncharacterized protein LOC110867972 [Helianthus annuus]KAF5797685.1 hypothetical protein HanXRQr2_Chr07g0283551 [Helianthus annuus]KAJ0549381.1 hypothetical protein HanHA300_Chr07g0232931 [Helianthus annuus]KAJ0555730.1 hypothetical protein HanIR_Chr07g0305421 [Helianthus annuus]KAJ0562335.1 hypothetical protein HanHA89_Chr07g0250101 [Helianthus annuus]KAJ0727711.1 hypothetical protein HanLR1_Chr07g0232881 [Helianthus annuus]